MAKSGQARVPTAEEWQRVFEVIQDHRHREKNTCPYQILHPRTIFRSGRSFGFTIDDNLHRWL